MFRRKSKRIIPIMREGFCPVHILLSREELPIEKTDSEALVPVQSEHVHTIREISNYIRALSEM